MNQPNAQENATKVNEIEVSIDQANEIITLGDDIQKLLDNPIFKRVIVEGYFEKEPARLVGLLTDTSMDSDKDQKDLHNDMIAISGFRRWIVIKQQMARFAKAQVASSEQVLDDLRDETEGA